MRQLIILLLFLVIFLIAGCGWHLRNTTLVAPQIKKIIFDYRDPYGPLGQAIRNRLHFYGIELINNGSMHQDIPFLRILNSSLSKSISVPQHRYTGEYHIILSISAALLMPGRDICPIDAKVDCSFFNNPKSALAKYTEEKILINEIYDKAAEQIIHNLLRMK